MNALSKYWNIWRISPANDRLRYQSSVVPMAQKFIENQRPHTSPEASDSNPLRSRSSLGVITPPAQTIQSKTTQAQITQALLLDQFRSHRDRTTRAQAGLCLRCYVSYPILKACQKIASLFASSNAFTYQDLLPFVLNDDGETLVILDSDDKVQLVLDDDGHAQPTGFKWFAVEVLRTYQSKDTSKDASKMSLDNWAYLQTKQNSELKAFLSEFGFQALSDWALLNRVRLNQLERLSDRDRHLVEVFHAVYRRDRLQQPRRSPKCPDPNSAQLSEMRLQLQERAVFYPSDPALLSALRQVAAQLRNYDLWQSREPLEIHDPETNTDTLRPDLPTASMPESDLEQQEWVDFLHQQLQLSLVTAIDQAIQDHLTKLTQSKKYAPYAPQFLVGLQQYYQQGLSLKDLVSQLGMTSTDQARRVLNPGELLNQVRTQTVQRLLEQLLTKAQAQGFATVPPEADYLKTLAEQIEAFVDGEIFQAAVAELKVAKNRVMASPYAQALISILEFRLRRECGSTEASTVSSAEPRSPNVSVERLAILDSERGVKDINLSGEVLVGKGGRS